MPASLEDNPFAPPSGLQSGSPLAKSLGPVAVPGNLSSPPRTMGSPSNCGSPFDVYGTTPGRSQGTAGSAIQAVSPAPQPFAIASLRSDDDPIAANVAALLKQGAADGVDVTEGLTDSPDPVGAAKHRKVVMDRNGLRLQLNNMNRMLINAKAAVARLRGQEEAYRVYIRNRDRILKRLLLKPSVMTIEGARKLVNILDETSLG